MKKTNKLWLALLLTVLVAALLAVGLTASAEEPEIVVSGICGDGLTCTLDSNGLLTVSGTGYLYDDAFKGCTDLKTVVLQDGVGVITPGVFAGCSNLKAIAIPASVSLIEISAFDSCSALSYIFYSGSPEQLDRIIYGYLEGMGGEHDAHVQSVREHLKSIARFNTVDWGYCGGEDDGTNLVWALDNDGTLTISGTGRINGYYYGYRKEDGFYSTAPWWNYHDSIQTLKVEEGITFIGVAAFRGCSSIKAVVLPVSLTRVQEWAFAECDAITDVFYGGDNIQWYGITYYDPGLNKDESLSNGVYGVGSLPSAHRHYNATWHTPGAAVIENEVAATCTTAGGYDEVVYCTQCPCELSRNHVTVDPLDPNGTEDDWTPITLEEPFSVDVPAENDYRYSFTPSETGKYTLAGVDNPFTTRVTLYDADFNYITDFPSDVVFSMYNTKIVFAFDLTAGQTYYYELQCYNNGAEPCSGSFVLTTQPPCETFGHTEHGYNVENEVAATCTAPRAEDWVYRCYYCNAEIRRDHLAYGDPLNHPNRQELPKVLPRAGFHEHGHEAGVWCPDCKTWLSGGETIHNQDGEPNVIKPATLTETGEAEIMCTFPGCEGWGLYELPMLEPDDPGEPDQPDQPDQPQQPSGDNGGGQSDNGGDSDNFFTRFVNGIKKAAGSFINVFLRLIRWLGGKK